jgi:hypothetical protein
MFLRISLIFVILAGLGAGGIAWYETSTQIPRIKAQWDKEKDAKVAEIVAHNETKARLKKVESQLAQAKQELAGAEDLSAKAVARADSQEKHANELSSKLAATRADLQDVQNQLTAYKASDLTPDDVVKLKTNLEQAQKEIAALNAKKSILMRHLALREGYGWQPDWDSFVRLNADLKGTIAAVDPKWNFVVLSIGDEQGAVLDGEMLVSRQGKLVAKIIIRSVQKDRCIADIVPGWKFSDVIEGDVVTPAHPTSS